MQQLSWKWQNIAPACYHNFAFLSFTSMRSSHATKRTNMEKRILILGSTVHAG